MCLFRSIFSRFLEPTISPVKYKFAKNSPMHCLSSWEITNLFTSYELSSTCQIWWIPRFFRQDALPHWIPTVFFLSLLHDKLEKELRRHIRLQTFLKDASGGRDEMLFARGPWVKVGIVKIRLSRQKEETLKAWNHFHPRLLIEWRNSLFLSYTFEYCFVICHEPGLLLGKISRYSDTGCAGLKIFV